MRERARRRECACGRGHRRRHRCRKGALAGTLAAARGRSRVRVVRVAGPPRLVQRLAALGIVPGAALTVERGSDPTMVEVGHTRVVVDRDVAAAVVVEEAE